MISSDNHKGQDPAKGTSWQDSDQPAHLLFNQSLIGTLSMGTQGSNIPSGGKLRL